MNRLTIHMPEDRKAFRPGEEVVGEVAWELEKDPESVELRLGWFTRGKGTIDADTVWSVRWDDARQRDRREFRLQLPDGPYSFSGKLISLIWELELTVRPGDLSERLELVVGPHAAEVVLGDAGPESANKAG